MKIIVNNAGDVKTIVVASGAQGPQGPIGALNADDRAYVDAAKASASASEASASASANTASVAETSATASAADALASKTAAGNSQTAAAGSATEAAASAAQIASSYAAFQKLFLGDLPSDPTTDNQGNPLVEGATYFNTTLVPQRTRTYTGGVWVDTNKDAETATASAQLSAAAASGSASAALSSQNAAAASKTATDTNVTATNASKTAAATSATNAGTSEANAAASEALASKWASQTSGAVDGVNYSAKQYALNAAASALAAQTWDPSAYVPKTGGAFLGNVLVQAQAANSGLIVDTSAAGWDSHILLRDQGKSRWELYKTGEAESGSDAGSNARFITFTDDGSSRAVMTFMRATQVVDFAQTPTVSGSAVWTHTSLGFTTAGTTITAPGDVHTNFKVLSKNLSNLLINGGAELLNDQWQSTNFSGGGHINGFGYYFTNGAALTAPVDDMSNPFSCAAATLISIQVKIWTPSAFVAGNCYVKLEAFNSSGVSLGIVCSTAPVTAPNGGFSLITATGTMPAGTTSVAVHKTVDGATVNAPSGSVLFKDIKVEQGSTASTYSNEATIQYLAAEVKTLQATQGKVLLGTVTCTGTQTQAFFDQTVVTSAYDEYEIEIAGLVYSVGTDSLLMRLSLDGTTISSANIYHGIIHQTSFPSPYSGPAVIGTDSRVNTAFILLASNIPSHSSGFTFNGNIRIQNIGAAGTAFTAHHSETYATDVGTFVHGNGSGWASNANPIKGFALISTAATMTGVFRLYGIKK